MPPSPAPSRTLTGMTLMTVGVACLVVNDAMAKLLAPDYAAVQILFLRNLMALPIAVAIAWRMGGRAALRSTRPAAHLVRGAIWLGAAGSFFTGLGYLGLAEATVLIFAAPLIITALSAVLLREPVGWIRWAAVLAGFAGVLVVVRPGADTFQPAAAFPLMAACFYAVLMLSARWVDPRESVWTLMLYLVGAGALASGLVVPFFWVPLVPADLPLFFGVAVFGTAGMTLMTQAFRFAPAPVIAPLDYTALIWATALGWAIWNEVPDLATYLGGAIIIASGIIVVLREHRATA